MIIGHSVHEVSTAGMRMMLRALGERGVDGVPLLRSLGVPEEKTRASGHWIDWDVWVEFMDFAARQLGSAAAVEELGSVLKHLHGAHRFEWVAQLFSSPAQLYELNSRWGVRSQFRHMHSTCRRLADDQLEVVTSMPLTYRGSEAAFYMAVGVVHHLPQVIGLPSARLVFKEVTAHSMRVVVEPPASRTLWQRARRGSAAFRGLESMFEQLSLQEGELFEQHQQLQRQLEEQARVQEALRASEARWKALAESAPGNILLLSPQGTILSASGAFEAASEQVVGKRLTELARAQDREQIEQALATLTAPGDVCDVQWQQAGPDGKARWIACRAGPVFADGQMVAKTVFLTDVTARVQAERSLKRREAELLQAQKMEVLGRLAGGIAHDFNNLLTVVLASVDLLKQYPSNSEDQSTELLEIQRAGERAAELTRQLLSFTRQQVVTPQVLDVAIVLRDVERMLVRLLGEDISLEINADAALRVKIDQGQLEQVLVNLAVNARDAMPRGGVLSVRVAECNLRAPQQLRAALLAAGDYVLIEVSDTGKGMDEETLQRAFEPFFSTKRRGLGTGLGLAIVRGIVVDVGGAIDVRSSPDRGTRFEVYLPLSEEAVVSQVGVVATLPLGGSETVLLVEDDAQVRRLAREILSRYGYRVLEAPKPGDAFELAAAQHIDLLVTDVVLPEVTGPQLARALQRNFPDLAVLFISGYAEDEIVHRGIVQPGVDLLSKPFRPEELAARVRSALDQRTAPRVQSAP